MAEYFLEDDTSWAHVDVDPARVDANVRLVASLIDAGDFEQLFRRTGIRADENGLPAKPALPVFLEPHPGKSREILEQLTTQLESQGLTLTLSATTHDELKHDDEVGVATAYFSWPQVVTAGSSGAPVGFRAAIARLIHGKGIRRVSVPNPLQPCLEDSLPDLEMPPGRRFEGRTLDGRGVVVGIIDDGCAFAHRNFLVPGTNETRIQYLWDQSAARVLDKPKIDAVLAAHAHDGIIDEDKVYEHFGYDLALASHGTHVMDIAAGNGASLMGDEGVASAADIVFVQLPRASVEAGGPVLEHHILEGVRYVFQRARDLGLARGGKALPAVVNISYGGYSGPHDGTSPLAHEIDRMLKRAHDRAVVVSAGNGFQADCHARQVVDRLSAARPLHWNLRPEDPTANQLEIWYEEHDQLEVSLTPPRAAAPLPPVVLDKPQVLKRAIDGKTVGWIENMPTNTGAHPNVIRIQLNGTEGEEVSATTQGSRQGDEAPPLTAPAPSGTWTVQVRNTGAGAATFHAWIARDDVAPRGRGRQQSRFAPGEADPRYTVADLATGALSICVGAHNTATAEMCGYSASGPTRDGRPKPDLTAPAEETGAGRGILCASSRRGQPSRFNGTSAAAPHVAGLVALLLQYNRDSGGSPLRADVIRQRAIDGARSAQALPPPPPRKLGFNRHQEADPARPPGSRQSDCFGDVIGSGKADVPQSL